MPISFGSVGDIIAICLVVKDLANALNDSRGSSSEYQEVVRELGILDRTLLEVEILVRTHQKTIELNALCETARRSVDNCQGLVEKFFDRVRKYDASLGERSVGPGSSKTKNVVGRAARKVQWRAGEREELQKFRTEIAANSASLNMLLAAANVKLQTINSRKIEDGFQRSDRKTQDALSKQDKTLEEIMRRLDETNKLIEMANAASGSSGMQGRADWANHLGQEMKNFMLEIIATNLAIYKAVINIQKANPVQPMTEETFLLEDAIGRVAPVPLQYIDSWDAFDAILEVRFRERQGFKKVLKKEYVLQNQATGNDIDRSSTWNKAFVPGQKVDMSMLFKKFIEEDEPKDQSVTCPICGLFSNGASDADLQCKGCDMWFRRISTIDENELEDREEGLPMVDHAPDSGRTAADLTASKPDNSSQQRENEDDMSKFKRVRLRMIRRKKNKTEKKTTPENLDDSTSNAEYESGNESMDNNATDSDTESTLSSDEKDPNLQKFSSVMNTATRYLQRSRHQVSLSRERRLRREQTLEQPRATEEEARRAGIPAGYSIRHWDPTEDPIFVLGSVFDCQSLGKWIYDWAVFHWGFDTPFVNMAGELWLLLITYASKTRRAKEKIARIRDEDNREFVEDFLESSDRLWAMLGKLVRTCGDRMKRRGGDKDGNYSTKDGGCDFVDAMFLKDQQLKKTEKLMAALKLWTMRFDAHCEEIIKNPAE